MNETISAIAVLAGNGTTEPFNPNLLAVILIVISILPFYYFTRRIRWGRPVFLRQIPAFVALDALLRRMAETGQVLHFSPGVAGINDRFAAETLAGLTTLDTVAHKAAVLGTPVVVTSASPTTFPIAQEIVRKAYTEAGRPEEFDPARVRFYPQNRNAYATAVINTLQQERAGANVMVGNFGDEYLLIGENAHQAQIPQIVGAANPQVIPFAMSTAEHVLVGEEMFASGAYLANDPPHVGSLYTQDILRLLLVLFLIVGVLLKTLSATP